MQAITHPESSSRILSNKTIEDYRHHGFVKITNLISAEKANFYREEALRVIHSTVAHGDDDYSKRLNQHVNIWQNNESLMELTMSKSIASMAEQLVGEPMLLWHDHLLSKAPNNAMATEWHQDQPYWPLGIEAKTTSVWIALQDTPEEMGCMNYIPESHHLNKVGTNNLAVKGSLFEKAPQLEYEPKVKIPLKTGDAVFHNGFCGHMATANKTDEWRIAHVIAYTEASTVVVHEGHVLFDRLGDEAPKIGENLNHPTFPRVATEGL
jgi:ectoine hydroxylase-related dioxygenase (phytanoyl-CoA dioxygenase family)